MLGQKKEDLTTTQIRYSQEETGEDEQGEHQAWAWGGGERSVDEEQAAKWLFTNTLCPRVPTLVIDYRSVRFRGFE